MMRQKMTLLLACLLLLVARVIAQECSEFVQTALATVEQACTGMARNQACYGNVDLTATGQPDASNFQFATVGDITDVAAIQSMQLSGYDPENGIWGVVMMQVQADIPNTLPGQNVTVLLFGDVTVRNAASSVAEQTPPEQEQTVRASSDVNVRAFPSTAGTIIGTISPNVSIIATGRSEDSQWIRVRFGAETGWISAQLLSSEFNINDLVVVTRPEAPLTTPMQAFYLTSGIGRPSCNQVPDDGMLVQTPEGVASINLFVNEVSVQMGSTVYFSINDEGDMDIAPIKGSARITTDEGETTIIEGGFVEVPLDEEFLPDGAPSDPQSYLGDEDIEDLPFEALEEEIVPDLGLTDEELQEVQELQPILDYVDVEDADDFFNYAEETENPDFVEYLVEEGYTDFGSELEGYFEEELNYDLSDYQDYSGDDVHNLNSNPDADGDGIIDSQDDFVDTDGDGVEDSQDSFLDSDGDGIEDNVDDFVDTDGNGYDDRYGNGDTNGGSGGNGMVDADGDGIDDSVDDFVDTDGNGYDDRYGNGDGSGDGGGDGSGDGGGSSDGGGGGDGSGSGDGGEDPCVVDPDSCT
jgi:uncharacterized protein YraI